MIALVGPTASGKTGLSIRLAERVPVEVISMDSRQIYRGMDIGTAKATPAQREAVPHHCLDLVHPDQRFSAAAWAHAALHAAAGIRSRGRIPLLVGGTGFYLRALTHPMFVEPPMDPEKRDRLRAWLTGHATDRLRLWLSLLDPEAAERLAHQGGRQRLLRALELPLLTGRRLSELQRQADEARPPLRPLIFVLAPPREPLRQAIDDRVTQMAREGLVEEVQSLLSRGYGADDPGMNATGYAELIPALAGEVPLAEALDRVRANTRAYARRQLTWFRHQLPPGAIWLDAGRPLDDLVEEIVAASERHAEQPTVTEANGSPLATDTPVSRG